VRADSIHLKNVRNHSDTLVRELAPKINILTGPNGAGKTSILEALSLTTLTKSFTTSTDSVLIRTDEQTLEVETRFFSDLEVPHRVLVTIDIGPPLKKTLFANSERVRSSADLIGRAPVVIITPDEKIITGGSPGERRRFLNMVLSQASRAYLEDEIEYRRALKQRNAVLGDARKERRSSGNLQAMLEPWTVLLIKHGSRIMRRRAAFCEEFLPCLTDSYALLSERRERPSIEYQPMGSKLQAADFATFLEEQSNYAFSEEIRRGTTLFGPHRDELLLCINPGQEARLYASQGQHKTLLVAMKLAEFEYLRTASGETPILLLDDVFSELDERRAVQLLERASSRSFGQTFITSTEGERFKAIHLGSDHRIFTVENGLVA